MIPTIGRIVHYRVGGTDETPELRPATIVRVWGPECVNLQVALDGTNDDEQHGVVWSNGSPLFTAEECARGQAWKTSASMGTCLGEWRWPARA